MDSPNPLPARPTLLDWTFRILGFLLLIAVGFTLPGFPAAELDSSWRMALGKFFVEGRQFGTEIVFTYGPLGWAMGKTYWGHQWGSLIGWHAVQAVVMAVLVFSHGLRLTGYSRVFFLLFFFLFGLTYQDAVQQTALALAGLELVRRSNAPWRWSSVALLVLLVIFSLVKFTNLLLALFLALLAGGLEFWLRRGVLALRVPAVFLLLFAAGWKLCGQQLGNIPAYVFSSLEISSGYQDAMGFSCPPLQLYLGLTVVALLVAYLAVNGLTHPNRLRGLALTLGATAYLYLNWKHGFIRADGHQIGFYYAALTIIVSAPLLLEDSVRLRWLKHLLLASAGLLSVFNLELVLPGLTRGVLAATQDRVDRNISFALNPAPTRAVYERRLQEESNGLILVKTQATVKNATLDVLGFEQAVAIFNGFNYQPRPVFQGYSAYTEQLSRLNYDYFASDRAPEFVLFKLQSIDYRLATMDDPHVLRLLVQRYTYLFSEQGFTLWQRKPGPFRAADFEPQPLRSVDGKLGESIDLADLASRNVWVEIDYRYNLLGRLRRFLFKPPVVQLRLTDDAGGETLYRLPQPIGRAGFMLNPVINDMMDFMRAAGGVPTRRARSLSVEVSPSDRDCLKEEIRVKFSSLPTSDAGREYFKNADNAKFHMFANTPVSYGALNPPNEDVIDKRRVMIMHAPSQMAFDVPAGATELRGAYGFVPGAYTGDGRTNGAQFIIYWQDGTDPVILLERFLNPVTKLNDRGLQTFSVRLPKGSGRVFLEVKPGPFNEFAFDWTGWTGIEFK
jgi:hypothetical protein